jgi:PAS domain S-box-containing protein
VRSLAAIPMVYRETLQGYVSLACNTARRWTDEDRYLLETLMEIAVAALEHRRVERALGETESLLQRVIYTTNHMVYVYAVMKDGSIRQMYSSSNIEHILGYPAALKTADWEFWTSLILPADRPIARMQLEKLMRGEDSETEYRMTHMDGRVVWVRDSARCEQGTGNVRWICYGVISDVTDRRGAEQALRDRERLQIALEAERKVGEVRNRFMLVVSHEFRTPLSIILTSSEMLDRYHDRMDQERRKERLGIIRAQVQHLRAMLDEISIVIRAELGRLEFRPLAADVAEFARQIAAEMASTVGTMHRITVTSDPDTLYAQVDTTLLRHVLTNLLSNAIKFSEERAEILLNLRLSKGDGEPEICFEVLDRGIGLQAGDLEHLFEPFFRGSNVGAISGTGLGLKVVRDCLLRHGGHISAEPRADGGSRFVARVPYEAAQLRETGYLPPPATEAEGSGFTRAG